MTRRGLFKTIGMMAAAVAAQPSILWTAPRLTWVRLAEINAKFITPLLVDQVFKKDPVVWVYKGKNGEESTISISYKWEEVPDVEEVEEA